MKKDTFQFNGDIPKDILFGVGYDIHRLVFGENIVLCGVKIPFDRAFDAHSDGDAPLHAVMDAVLSSLGQKDIGHLFPVNDDAYKGADSADLLKQVLNIAKQKGYKLYALTNWSAEKFPWAKENFKFFALFDAMVVSGQEKCIKPFPKIYQILLSRYNLKAEDCIFIDDNIKNVEAARELGFSAIRFTSPQELKNELSILLKD